MKAHDEIRIRDASPTRDGHACADIYAYYVTDTVITFENDAPDGRQMAQRIELAGRSHAWLVLESGDRVLGYAYAHEFSARSAYQWSCETSIYLDAESRGRGGGRMLYQALLDRLAALGYHRAFAGITQPNEASNAIHRSFGFERVGEFRRVGWKNGAWHDVAWLQRDLQSAELDASEPQPIVIPSPSE